MATASASCGTKARVMLFLMMKMMMIMMQMGEVYGGEYVRPGPKPLVNKKWDKAASEDPEQVHVSLAGEGYMRVTWLTHSRSAPSVVDYGTSSGVYSESASAGNSSERYCFFSYKSPYIHNVVIGPLLPDTVYYYICGRGGSEYSFKTPPAALPLTFAIVGDLGQTEWTEKTLNHVKATAHDVFLLPGDLSYADCQQPLWDSFGRLVESAASSRPWMVTQGNHDMETIPILMPHAFKAYNARWRMPYQICNSTSNLYYSFDVAAVHVIMLGSYTDFDHDSAQYAWLKEDLRKVDRVNKTPWVIVLLHAPWYNTNEAHQGEGESMRKAMESLLYSARVDIVFAGHVHAYERFTRIYNNTADPCGPMYITVGDGGNREGLAMNFKKPQSKLSLFREASFGHGVLKFYDNNSAEWTWHRNQDDVAAVADSVGISSLASQSSCVPSAKHTSHLKDEL